MPNTQIIATLGPSSRDYPTLCRMLRAGMRVARLNFSHGTHEEHAALIAAVRKAGEATGRKVQILQDLEGFRIRVGLLEGHHPVELKKLSRVRILPGDGVGSSREIYIDYAGPLDGIRPGQSIFVDDGSIELVVRGRKGKTLEAEVLIGGILKERKGVNIPGARLAFKGFTAKDAADLKFGIHHRVDFIAQSFVRTKEDMVTIRRRIRTAHHSCRLIAKIENREGIRNLDGILEASDGIMIARGDMGVSVPIEEIPILQKEIIARCRRAGKFSITATQMLESMTLNRRPTRAEVTDVANAVLDGSEYVMLSGETAAGRYPVETVAMMEAIVRFTEKSAFYRSHAPSGE